MKRLFLAALALAGAAGAIGWCSAPVQAAPALAAPARGHFAGKFELVPLFDKTKPVQRNGHSYYGLRNAIAFTMAAGDTVTMPAGMVTDMASVPQIFWPLLPPDGPWAEASVPHDLCFKSKGSFSWFGKTWRTRPAPYSRSECNEILRQAMVALGVPAWKRIVIYEGVQAGAVVAPGAWGS